MRTFERPAATLRRVRTAPIPEPFGRQPATFQIMETAEPQDLN